MLALPLSPIDARPFLPIQALVACQLPCPISSPSLTIPEQLKKKTFYVIMKSNSITFSPLMSNSVQDLPSHCCSVAKSCPIFYHTVDCSLPGSSVRWISQARILERVASFFSRGSSWPRGWAWVSCTDRRIPYHGATRRLFLHRARLTCSMKNRLHAQVLLLPSTAGLC